MNVSVGRPNQHIGSHTSCSGVTLYVLEVCELVRASSRLVALDALSRCGAGLKITPH